MDVHTTLSVAAAISILVVIGAGFLIVGGWIKKRSSTARSSISVTLHLMAATAAIVGGALAWMAFETDHPSKWKHLALPVILVAIVYGYALRSGVFMRSTDETLDRSS